MALIVKRPWTRQPQVAAALNPALRKPTAVWLGSSPSVNLVGSIPVVNSNIGIGPSVAGVVGKSATSSTANSIQLTPTRDLIFPGGAATIAVLRRKTDTTARVATVFGNNAANRILLHAPYSDGNVYWDFGNDTTGRLSVAFGAITTDWEAIVVVAGPTKGREIWRNKNRLAADTSKTFAPTSGTMPWYLFSTGVDVSDVEEKALVVITASEWTDAEIRSWVDNPWAATFAPLPRRIWAPVAAGGAALASDFTTLSSITAELTTGIALSASPSSASVVTAALTTGIALSASPSSASAVSAALTTGSALTTTASAQSTVTAGLTTNIALSASPSSASVVTAALTTGIALRASPLSASVMIATLTTGSALTTDASAQSTVTAGLTTGIALAATASAQSTVTAVLTLGSLLAATASAQSTVTAGLTTKIALSAIFASYSTVTASLTAGLIAETAHADFWRVPARLRYISVKARPRV